MVAQIISETQSRQSWIKDNDEDKHLQMFHKLKLSLFKGVVEPQTTEDWLRSREIVDRTTIGEILGEDEYKDYLDRIRCCVYELV
ncbi:hypothetical protein IEQ34_003546 [Dendrobium chrysotoxum]|uniref:Uncharacterized protein n=1 Tax=Dendrobium chrysotoxum TaxID=161865 RepID=A0AAV7HLY8_DENCH|nr:hypothetical protein IEQ34_003546 [Dendrobium chrysotoxum]